MVRQWIDACVWRQETHLAETDGFAFLEPDEIKQDGPCRTASSLMGCCAFADRMFAGDEKAKSPARSAPSARASKPLTRSSTPSAGRHWRPCRIGNR